VILVDTVERAEKVDKELSRMIEKRSRNRDIDPDEKEPGYMESVRRYNARLEVEVEHARLTWAKHLRGVYAARKEEYERLVQTLEGTERKETP
jgi:hypothetical protein